MEKSNYIKYLLSVSYIFFLLKIFAQNTELVSARSTSLATCITTLNDLTLINVNPTNLVSVKKFSAGLQYENSIVLPELQNTGFVFAKQVGNGGIGVGLQTFGCNFYRILTCGLNYGIKLTDELNFGVHLGIKNFSIQNYGNRTIPQLSLAFQGKISNGLNYGVTIQSIGKEYEKLKGVNSILFCLGVKYRSSESLSIYSEIEKSLISPMRIKVAFEYQPLKSMYLRVGVLTSNYQFSGGFGCKIKEKYRFDFGSAWQPITGLSFQVGILFYVNENG